MLSTTASEAFERTASVSAIRDVVVSDEDDIARGCRGQVEGVGFFVPSLSLSFIFGFDATRAFLDFGLYHFV